MPKKWVECPWCNTALEVNPGNSEIEDHDCPPMPQVEVPRKARMGICPGCHIPKYLSRGEIIRPHLTTVKGPVNRDYLWRKRRCATGGLPLEVLPALVAIAELAEGVCYDKGMDSNTSKLQKLRYSSMLHRDFGIFISSDTLRTMTLDQLKRMVAIMKEA